MLIKTILNKIEKFKSFIYGKITMERISGRQPDSGSESKTECERNLSEVREAETNVWYAAVRLFEYVPVWGIPVYFKYSPRRTDCRKDGVLVEVMPGWGERAYDEDIYDIFIEMGETVVVERNGWNIRTSWDSVFRAVRYVVEHGSSIAISTISNKSA